jgi:hypothetical protein
MSAFYKDIMIATMFIIGIFGFVVGEFIISSSSFAGAVVTSYVALSQRLKLSKN